jgi:hypothetical protein
MPNDIACQMTRTEMELQGKPTSARKDKQEAKAQESGAQEAASAETGS